MFEFANPAADIFRWMLLLYSGTIFWVYAYIGFDAWRMRRRCVMPERVAYGRIWRSVGGCLIFASAIVGIPSRFGQPLTVALCLYAVGIILLTFAVIDLPHYRKSGE